MKLRSFKWDTFTRLNNQNIRCNEIYVWAKNEQSESCLLRIRGYHSSIYIELPDDYTESKANLITTWLNLRFPDEIVSGTFIMKKKLYGAYVNDNVYPHILLKLFCDRSIYNIIRVLDSEVNIPGIGDIYLKYHENNIPTILKFQTERGIEMSGWLEVNNYTEENSEDCKTAIPEYYCLWNHVHAVKEPEYRDKILPCKILSFDHEAYSERKRQMPNWENWKDVIFMTGITTKTYKQNDTKKYIFMTYKRPDFNAKKSKYLDPPFSKEDVREHVREDIIIKWFDKERDLIHGIERFITEYDPDVLIGYNILGFDYSFMVKRLKRLGDHPQQMGRIIGIPPRIVEQKWESGAYGKQEFVDIQMQGRISIDLLTVIKREHKLPSYKLDYIGEKFLGENKEDVNFKEIFSYYESDDPKLHAAIANYCSTDTELPIKLFERFHVWDNVVVTSCIVNVSINDLYTRGQQLRGYYQIYKLATKDNIVVRFTPKSNDETLDELLNDDDDDDDDDEGEAGEGGGGTSSSTKKAKAKKDQKYSGATVVDPIVGLHKDVQSFDFKSLYPSIQRAYNICYTTFVPDGEFVPEARINIMEWDDPKDHEHYKFRWIKDRIGIVPLLLKNLVDQRDEARAAIKKTSDESLKIVLDMRQLQLKISANSLYGMMGVGEGKAYLPLKEGAQCVTYVGRTTISDTIEKIKDVDVGKIRSEIIQEKTGEPPKELILMPDGKTPFPQQKNIIVYGDSVTGDTPLLIKKDGAVKTCRIDSLVDEYIKREDGKEISEINAKVWTENGFTQIQQIVRHKTTKKLYRVLTHTGLVDVTEDHSLLLENKEMVKPSDVDIKTKLLHGNCLEGVLTTDNTVSKEEAKVMGFFFGDGSCGNYGYKYTWALNNANIDFLKEMKQLCPFETEIYDTIGSSNVYKLNAKGDVKTICLKYRSLFYNEHKEKIIPSCILNAPYDIAKSFLDGYYMADGDKDKNGYTRMDTKGKEGAMGLFILGRKLGYNVSLNTRTDKLSITRLTWTKKTQRRQPTAIKKIDYLGETTDYVYDLTTESHHFHVGPGELVVHNTDSCMFKFGVKDGDPGFEIGERIAEHISAMLPPPMKLESENWFARYLIITKKRYAAIKRSDKDNPKKGLKKGDAMLDINDQYKRGLVDARRDNCMYLRETCTTTLRRIMLLEEKEAVRDYVLDRCFQLLYQNVSYDKLMISTAINKEKYKSDSAFQNCLAVSLREKGFDIRVGDRIEYFFKWIPDLPGVKTLKADHTEVIETLKTNRGSVHIDYGMYIPKQLQKPIDQLTSVRFNEEYIKHLCGVLKYRKKMLDELEGLFSSITRLVFAES